MALFSKDGKEFVELPDSAEDFDKMKEAGYQPYMAFTSDGEEYVALPAEVSNWKKMQEAGYKTADEWDYMQGAGKPKVQPGAGEAFLGAAAEELSLGAGKYAAAALETLKGGSSFGKELEVQKYLQKRREEEQPLASFAGTLAGGIGTGIATAGASGLVKAAAPATTLVGRMAMGAAGEGIPEAVKGVLQSEEQDLGGKLLEGGVKGVIGGLTGGFGGALTKTPEAIGAVGEVAGVGVQAAKGTGKLLSSAQQALVESGRRTEGSGWITKQVDKIGSLVENIKQNYSTLGETRALVKELRQQMGEEVADIADKDLLAYVSALPGPNPVKVWQANKIANATNGDPKEILQALELGPDAVSNARLFDAKQSAAGIAEEMQGAVNRLRPAMQARYGQLQELARQNFAKQPPIAQQSILEGIQSIAGLKSKDAEGAMGVLQDAYAKLSGMPTGRIRVTADMARWSELSPQEQFDALKSVRRNLDAYLFQGGIIDRSGKQLTTKLSDSQQAVKQARKEVDNLLKSADEMVENDKAYSAFKGIEQLILDKASIYNKDTDEFILVPERLRALFKDTTTGGELRLRMQIAENMMERLPAAESMEIKSVLDSVNQALKASKQADDLEAVYNTSAKLTKSQVKGLEAFFGAGQLPITGVVSPEDKVKSYARLVEFSKRFLQKDSFDQLSPKEKMALLELEAIARKKGMIGKDALLDATWQKIAQKKKLGV